MRNIAVVVLAAAGIGLAATAGASAAPVRGGAILHAIDTNPVTQAQWWHDPGRSHWRWGSRGGPGWGHDPRRSHWRWGSRGGPGWGHDPGRSHWRWGSRGPRPY